MKLFAFTLGVPHDFATLKFESYDRGRSSSVLRPKPIGERLGVQQSGISDFLVHSSVPVRMSGRINRMGKQYESSGTSWYELVSR
jgi:hypothetical protein